MHVCIAHSGVATLMLSGFAAQVLLGVVAGVLATLLVQKVSLVE